MNTKNKFTVERIKNAYLKQKNSTESNKYILLYLALKHCILNVELPYNWHLPSTRYLADELDLSRTTVLKAYDLLLLEKLIVSKAGSGNRVNYQMQELVKVQPEKKDDLTQFKYPEISEVGKSYLKNINLINRLPNEDLAFRPGLPPLDVFPVNQWKNLLNLYWRYVKSSSLSYSQSTGLAELKSSICNYLNISRNVKCSPDEIIIVSGSLQSLFLIAETVINKNDGVVVENPLFPNVHSVFKSSKATLIPAGLDAEGISLKQMDKVENENIKLVHVTPSNHYPLGVKMSLQRRLNLLAWASEKGALIIENDYENEVSNLYNNVPSIYSLDNERRTIYMGTFNRLLHPSIRLGYMIVPPYLKPPVEALLEHSHRFVSPSIQVVMSQFIEKNYLYQHIKNTLEITEQRYELFKTEFNQKIKSMHLQALPFASFHTVAFFNKPTSPKQEAEAIDKLKSIGVTAFSLSRCYATEPVKTGLIFGFSAVRPNILIKKVDEMSKILNQL